MTKTWKGPQQPAPGFTLMRLGIARREFGANLGQALRPYGSSPAVPRAPDDWWCTVKDGRPVHSRCETIEHAIRLTWAYTVDHLNDEQRVALYTLLEARQIEALNAEREEDTNVSTT